MRYVLLICGEGREEPSPAEIVAMPEFIAWEARLRERGVTHAGARLRPPASAVTVRVRAGEPLVTDGPFAETREQIGGFEIVECAGPDEAIEIAAGHPGATSPNRVAVRPVFDAGTGAAGAPVSIRDTGPPFGIHRYAMMVCLDESAQPDPALATADDWVEQARRRGVWRCGQRLSPTSDATMVSTRDGEVLTTGGPFATTREQVVRLDLLECAGLDEAVEVAASHPVAEVGCVEIRPLWED